MNFTYCRKEEVIILSTRRNTKKFYQIVENPKVAVLIHDFPVAKQWSITLNGVAEVGNHSCCKLLKMDQWFRGGLLTSLFFITTASQTGNLGCR
jgi:hypothetical protein